MHNEFVVRDPNKLGVVGDVVRTADHVMQVLDESAESLGTTQPELAEAFEAITDLLQAAVWKHAGVEVRRAGAAEADVESAEIALKALRINLACQPTRESDDELSLRSRQQLVASSLQAYRDAVAEESEGPGADELLGDMLVHVDSITKSFGNVSTAREPYVNSHSIVLVEHDRLEREALTRVLIKNGFQVHAFADDETALQCLCGQQRGTVLLLNWQHPDAGRATLQRIRDCSGMKSIPIIAMSGMSLAAADVQLESSGIQAWFQKPFRPTALLNALRPPPISNAA